MGGEEIQDTDEVLAVRREWPNSKKEWDRRVDDAMSAVLEAPLRTVFKNIRTWELYEKYEGGDVSTGNVSSLVYWSFEDQVRAFAFGLGVFDMQNERKQLQKWDAGGHFTSDADAYRWLMENLKLHPSLTKLAWLVTTGKVTHAE